MLSTLFKGGKLPRTPLPGASGDRLSHSRLFFIRDQKLGLRFLIDTGAEISVLALSSVSYARKKIPNTLQAVNKMSIAIYGEHSLALDLGLRHSFQWVFLIADVTYAIIGLNIFRLFRQLIDMQNKRLVDEVTCLTHHGIACA